MKRMKSPEALPSPVSLLRLQPPWNSFWRKALYVSRNEGNRNIRPPTI
jgi:hypothetical protein